MNESYEVDTQQLHLQQEVDLISVAASHDEQSMGWHELYLLLVIICESNQVNNLLREIMYEHDTLNGKT